MISSHEHNIASFHNEISQNDSFHNSNENFISPTVRNKNDKSKDIQFDSKSRDGFKITKDNKTIKLMNEIEESKDNNIILNKFSSELVSKARDLAQQAIKNNSIFSIYGPYEHLRRLLRQRGWLEKKVEKTSNSKPFIKDLISNKNTNHSSLKIVDTDTEDIVKISEGENIDNELYQIATLLVNEHKPDFIWSLKMSQIDMNSIKSNQLINHFQKSGSFTTKIGLIKGFNYLRWFEKNPDEVFPRSYILSDENEKKAFLNDYYFTACLSLVKLTSQTKCDISDSNSEIKLDTNNSRNSSKKVVHIINGDNNVSTNPLNMIDRRYPEMAFNYCRLYLNALVNKDLDTKEIVFCSSKRWEEFFSSFWNVTFDGYGIQCTDSIRNHCKDLCNQFEKIIHQYNLNGTKNIWIVKPGAKSRGRGISCVSKFSELNNLIQQSSEILIVQKYIERPLLVYNTKFDIRQWFLVTSWSPLTIWWYKDSYIRFCSQQFTLYDLNEAVHLSNNSIQYKYENGIRSKNLPSNNMWTWQSLENYLNNHGYINGWQKSILPSMKNIIIDILLCSQEEIEDRKNSFELYGADFMVTEDDLKTWLLEINSSPCLAPSTDITAKLTKQVLEDLLKVVLDYPKNFYCDTGQFDLLYRQSPFLRSIIDSPSDFSVIGSGLRRPASFLNPNDKLKPSPKYANTEHHLLNEKLRYIIGNSELNKNSNLVKENQSHELINSAHFLRNLNPDSINEHNNYNSNTIKQTKFSKLQMDKTILFNYRILSLKRKSIRLKNNQQENIFPIIKLDREKSKFRNQIADKYSKIGNNYESKLINKIDILRASESNLRSKRTDQLMKAYMSTLGNY